MRDEFDRIWTASKWASSAVKRHHREVQAEAKKDRPRPRTEEGTTKRL